MRHLFQLSAAMLIIFLTAGNISAQSEQHPILVCSFQKVKMGDIETVNKMIKEKFAPVLNSCVDDKMLLSWGQFNHSWGDEWNVNIWYVVNNMDGFNKFWEEYLKRINEKQPDAWKELRAYIQEHKDKIYTIQNQYPVPPSR